MAPEIVGKQEYLGAPTDIWASGVLLYSLLCGAFPFIGVSDQNLFKKIEQGIFSWP